MHSRFVLFRSVPFAYEVYPSTLLSSPSSLFLSGQENVAAVNEALSELYIEDEDHEKLRESVDDYDNFDQVMNG